MAALPLLLLIATACGSTVAPSGNELAGGGSGQDGLSAGTNGLTPADGGSISDGNALAGGGGGQVSTGVGAAGGQAGVAGSNPGTGSPSGAGSNGAGGTSGAGTPSGSQAAAGTVPGVEGGFIKIGIVRVSNRGAAYEAVGASGLAGSGYEQQMTDAMVAEINKTGIHGLKVKLVYYDVDANDASTPADVHQQQACSAWTQDDRVFAAMTGEGEVLDACLSQAEVVEVCGSCAVSTYDDKQMAAVPLLFSPNGVTVDRQVDFYVKGLVEGGYFTGAPGPPKMGFLTYDDPVRRRQFPRLEAELKARTGLTFAEKGFLPPPDSSDGGARALAALQNFILKFKAAGVNRVMMLDNSGQAAAYGMQAADANGFYPRWGFNSTSTPGGLYNAGVVPDSQTPGMTVVGWWPAGDIGIKEHTQRPPGLDSCLAIYERAGIPPMRSDTDFGFAGQFCDRFLFLRDALLAAAGVSVNNFTAGARSLGSAFKTSVGYGSSQDTGHRDGGSVYRVAGFNQECKCFEYVGPPQDTP